jgi:hypothetical protein
MHPIVEISPSRSVLRIPSLKEELWGLCWFQLSQPEEDHWHSAASGFPRLQRRQSHFLLPNLFAVSYFLLPYASWYFLGPYQSSEEGHPRFEATLTPKAYVMEPLWMKLRRPCAHECLFETLISDHSPPLFVKTIVKAVRVGREMKEEILRPLIAVALVQSMMGHVPPSCLRKDSW